MVACEIKGMTFDTCHQQFLNTNNLNVGSGSGAVGRVIPEIHGSNLVIGNLIYYQLYLKKLYCRDKNEEKKAGKG